MSSRFARRTAPATPISEEVATDQVCALLDYYDFSDAQREQLTDCLDKVVDYVRRGTVEVLEGGKLTINLTDGKTKLDVAELGARHRLALDAGRAKGGYSAAYGLMGALTGIGQAGIEKLPAKDLIVLETIGAVFLIA